MLPLSARYTAKASPPEDVFLRVPDRTSRLVRWMQRAGCKRSNGSNLQGVLVQGLSGEFVMVSVQRQLAAM